MMKAFAIQPLRIKSTGTEYLPGERVDASPEKLKDWAAKGLVRIYEQEILLPVVVASDGRVLARLNDPPLIRAYAWALLTLSFSPVDESTAKSLNIPSGEMNGARLRNLAAELRMEEMDLQTALSHLVRDGDLMSKTERGRGKIYWLAPLRYQ